MRYSKCESLTNKMIEKDENFSWNESNNREQRIQQFKNIISEYNKCNLKEEG